MFLGEMYSEWLSQMRYASCRSKLLLSIEARTVILVCTAQNFHVQVVYQLYERGGS